jgi:hypothetical protein
MQDANDTIDIERLIRHGMSLCCNGVLSTLLHQPQQPR